MARIWKMVICPKLRTSCSSEICAFFEMEENCTCYLLLKYAQGGGGGGLVEGGGGLCGI